MMSKFFLRIFNILILNKTQVITLTFSILFVVRKVACLF